MRIVIVASELRHGGVNRVVSLLTRQWAKHHYVVIVLFNPADPAYNHEGRIKDLLLCHVDARLKKAFALRVRLTAEGRQRVESFAVENVASW